MAAIKPNPCSCIICHQETSQLGIQTHFQRKHTETDKWDNTSQALKNKAANNLAEKQREYDLNPKFCLECNTILPFEKRLGNFCNHTCSATFTNRKRTESGWKPSEETKQKIRDKAECKRLPTSKAYLKAEFEKSIVGKYSKIFLCKCKFCSELFYAGTSKKVCTKCKFNYYRAQDLYRFKFNVYEYPELFDLDLLNRVGWYSQGGKSRKPKNVNGVSRDHKVSVSEALANNYNHYYISHIMNCVLMTQSENSSKNGKSSISYDDLIELVDEYDGRAVRLLS